MAAEDQFLLLPSVASFRHPPPILGSSSSSQRQLLTQGACIGWTQVDAGAEVDPEMEAKFLSNTVHNAMAVCSSLRPSVDISVGAEGGKSTAGGARNY